MNSGIALNRWKKVTKGNDDEARKSLALRNIEHVKASMLGYLVTTQ